MAKIEGNDMQLHEFQEWMESGKSSRDAAVGLLFHAATTRTLRAEYVAIAHVTALLDIGETLHDILTFLKQVELNRSL